MPVGHLVRPVAVAVASDPERRSQAWSGSTRVSWPIPQSLDYGRGYFLS